MRQTLIKVYQDTLTKTRPYRRPKTTKHSFSDNILKPGKSSVDVLNTDSVTVLIQLHEFGKTCVLNMATSKKPGGGVSNGARAQEESLFRCSNLSGISHNHYPLNFNTCLYSKDVKFIKDFKYADIPAITTDVITMAALDLSNGTIQNYEQITRLKVRLVLSLAQRNNIEVLILGAWGCGVYKNDPNYIANLFKEEINKFTIKNIIFPVINDHNSADDNYNIFKNIL